MGRAPYRDASDAACPRPISGEFGCIHVLGHPTRPLDVPAAPADAQVFNCHNFCLLLARAGVPFVYYGLSGSRLPAGGELADVGDPTGPWEYGNDWHREYTHRLDALLSECIPRHPEPQIIVSLYGCAQADIEAPERFGLPVVEAMVGYDHCWAPYRVFPSYAHQHAIYARGEEHVVRYMWFDTVIPHFVDADAYRVSPERDQYVLYLGRNAPNKGVGLAEDLCLRAGLEFRRVHDGVWGEEKTELISRAVAVIMPTVYVEPFGYVAVEAQMCGVPAVTTDWGAFVETVEHGRTGFRCRTAAEFLEALRRAPELDPHRIRDRAVRLYSIEAVTPAYLAYFRFVLRVHADGYFADGALREPFFPGSLRTPQGSKQEMSSNGESDQRG